MPNPHAARQDFMTVPSGALAPGRCVNSDHPAVIAFASRHALGATDIERAVSLHYAVRDVIRYDPYPLDLTVPGMSASATLERGHGYAEILLDGAWRKATPAFNLQLCEKVGLLPLEFDGRADPLYHAFDGEGRRHMEYVARRGTYDDVPVARIVADLRSFYPDWLAESASAPAEDFLADVDREVTMEGNP